MPLGSLPCKKKKNLEEEGRVLSSRFCYIWVIYEAEPYEITNMQPLLVYKKSSSVCLSLTLGMQAQISRRQKEAAF